MRVSWVLVLIATHTVAQSTQGVMAGRITDLRSGMALGGAEISWENTDTGAKGAAVANGSGYYALAPLSPGSYAIHATADRYQSRSVYEIRLAVAGRIDLNLALALKSETLESRSLPVAGSRFRITFFGPDALSMTMPVVTPDEDRSLLDATRSQVIDAVQIRDLPFLGRDVYTMLVMQPGVSSDGATARGLGYSAGGQRSAAANFMLDGVGANQNLLSGPLMSIPPEAVAEYRVSTGNFSAEFGSSAGYLANAITVTGSSSWHALGWADAKNEALNANDFQNNLQGLRRPALREYQTGYQVGGPLIKDRYFLASSLEYYHSGSHNPAETVILPSTTFLSSATAPDSLARQLLTEFPPPPVQGGGKIAAPLTVAPPVTINRWFGSERFDGQSQSGAQRLMGRVTLESDSQPDFIWSPYRDFISGLRQPALSFASNLTSTLTPGLSNELRVGITSDAIEWARAHPEIPTLVATGDGVLLPGSLAFYGFRNREHVLELSDELYRVSGRHIVRFGGSGMVRGISGFLTAGQDGRYTFQTLVNFGIDSPSQFSLSLNRQSLPNLEIPQFARNYRDVEGAAFVQDTVRLTPRFTLNLGLRYEYFSAPANVGARKDAQVVLGSGIGFPAMLANATLSFPAAGNESPYSTSPTNVAARAGFSRSLSGNARTVLRGGWGIFYDRPFDNLWENVRNNNLALATFDYRNGSGGYLAPIPQALSRYANQPVQTDFPGLTMFQGNWKTGYAMTDFLGIQREIGETWSVEVGGIGSLDRHLLTTDQINRPFSIAASAAGPDNFNRGYNPNLPMIAYRGSQGSSSYNALTAVARYHANGRSLYVAYTWSHSIDNQSDPLAGDFFDLNFASLVPAAPAPAAGTFSRQFDSRSDKASSDFDQRQNLVFYSIWQLPSVHGAKGMLRDWKISQMAAFRAGFPFTVYAATAQPVSGGTIFNTRADLTGELPASVPKPVPGGFQVLDPSQFAAPAPGLVGSSGRNAFAGPGFFNVDVSLSRSFPVRALSESGRLTLRADAFNVLNHANLGQPDSRMTSPTFGDALYGRMGQASGFPSLVPFRETARQIQLLLRLEF
jgi:hypothetical protein